MSIQNEEHFVALPIVVFEIGLNGNGRLDLIKRTVDAVCDQLGYYPLEKIFFKFQKREPEVSTPRSMWNVRRISPKTNNEMSYLEYRKEMEFSTEEYYEINQHIANRVGRWNAWFVSVWDVDSAYWVREYWPEMPFVKLPSAHLKNEALLDTVSKFENPVVLSTGGATVADIRVAVSYFNRPFLKDLWLLACTTTYPTPDEEVNITKMDTLRDMYISMAQYYAPRVGFSSHSSGILPVLMAGVMGADMIEFHVTTDRTLPGSDHAASLEGGRIGLIMRELLRIPIIRGNGIIEPSSSELEKLETLRD